MKHFILLIFSLSILLTVKAQVPAGPSSVTGRISGIVIDSVTKKPLDYATVTIYRSKGKVPLNGTLTDDKGAFKLNNINPGNYKITVTYIGYPTKTFDPVVTTPAKPDNNMGSIILSPGANALKEVAITGQQNVVENKIDKIVYNAEKDITSSGGNATDLLRKVPLLSVDLDGNVSLRGSQNVRVLINGKPSGAMANNLADVLKSIPADQIKNVEVITSPSAKYDAEGSAGIINIITKRKDISGVSGSVSGGVGTRQNNGNFNLNIKQNRLSVSGNLGGNYSWPQTSVITSSLVNSSSTVLNSFNGQSKASRLAYIASGNLGYDFNNFNSFSSTIRVNSVRFKTDGANDIYDAVNSNSTQMSNNKTKVGGFDWSGDYTRKFKKEGEELTFAGQWSHNNLNTDYSSLYSVNQSRNEIGANDGINDEYTAQVDYTLPVNKTFTLETGAKGIFRNINSDYQIQSQVSPNVFTLNNDRSNIYDYHQDVYSGYGVFGFNLKKSWAFKAGGRVENTVIDGSAQNQNTPTVSVDQNYLTFVPSLVLSKGLKNSQTVKLSYTKRIQRPSLQLLNPFLNKSNEYSQSQGNPDLAPEIAQTLEFNYSTFVKTTVINFSVFYKRTSDVIESYSKPIETNKTLSTNGNVGVNNSFGASFFGSINPTTKLTFRTSLNAYTYDIDLYDDFANLNGPKGTYLMYNAFVSGSYKFNGGLSAESFIIANSPRRNFQGKNPSFNMWIIGVKKEIMKKKGSLGLNMIDPFNEKKNFSTRINAGPNLQTSNFALPFRSFGVNFSYNFGKLNFTTQQPKKKRGVNNDDLKQGESQGGGGQGTGNQ